MLSPGRYYEKIPKDRRENLAFRRAVLLSAEKDVGERRAWIEACRDDILLYINVFGWTYNPKAKGSQPRVLPFITWGFQDEALRVIVDHIDQQKPLVIEKSRDMGASWMCDFAMEWLWHFHDWTQSLMISRQWDLVDGKTPDSLFWKLDFIHKHLPEWMLPEDGFERTKGYFEHKETHSTMTGQATTEKAGVGGRASVMFFDEFSRVPQDFEVRDSTADTADCRIFNSTHTGPGTAFAGLCSNGVTDKLVLHWTRHPTKGAGQYRYDPETNQIEILDKNYVFPPDFPFVYEPRPTGGPCPGIRSPWYDDQCRERGSTRAVAVDLDIDVSGSQSTVFDALVIGNLRRTTACDPYWRGDVRYDRDGKPLELVKAADGPLMFWCHLNALTKMPAAGNFVFGADVAQGTGATPSCISGLDLATGVKVVEYTNPKIDAKELAYVAVALCRLFANMDQDPAMLAWERAGPGIVFGGKVMELGMLNVYYQTDALPFRVTPKIGQRPGWDPNPDTIRVLIEDYRSALALRQFINCSDWALKECMDFRYDSRGEIQHANIESKDDPSGARVNHGDRVFADALAWMLGKHRLSRSPAKKEETSEPAPSTLAWRRQLVDNQREAMEAWL